MLTIDRVNGSDGEVASPSSIGKVDKPINPSTRRQSHLRRLWRRDRFVAGLWFFDSFGEFVGDILTDREQVNGTDGVVVSLASIVKVEKPIYPSTKDGEGPIFAVAGWLVVFRLVWRVCWRNTTDRGNENVDRISVILTGCSVSQQLFAMLWDSHIDTNQLPICHSTRESEKP